MARAYNMKFQLMTRFKRAMQVLQPAYTLVDDTLADGSPAVLIYQGATVFAYAAIDPMSFNGFNIVGEISSSAGEGTPEHTFMLYFQTNAAPSTFDVTGVITGLAMRVGCSNTQIYGNTTVPAAGGAVLSAGNLVQDVPNSDQSGASGA